jgi:putative Mg2+ transporter-C (MgtC) family protein
MLPHDLILAWPSLSRLLIALFFGSIIGWQRQMHGSAAGLRTHVVVCLAANLLTNVDLLMPTFMGKLPAAVITGVGFLGAGTILRSDKGDTVHGLTTAASVWATAAIGIAIGSGGIATWLGSAAAILVLLTLSAVYQLEEFALRHTRLRNLCVPLRSPAGVTSDETIKSLLITIKSMGVVVEAMRRDTKGDSTGESLLRLRLRLPNPFDPDHLLLSLTANADVGQARWDL